MVAENLHAQCDNDGNVMRLVDEIVDHRSDNTVLRCPMGNISISERRLKEIVKISKVGNYWSDGKMKMSNGCPYGTCMTRNH